MKVFVNFSCFKDPKTKMQGIKIKHHMIYIHNQKFQVPYGTPS